MKQIVFGILFTFLYLLAMVRPLLPLIEYYTHYNYIVNELCINKDRPYIKCNGACYLNAIIEKANLPTDNLPQKITTINLSDYPISTLDFDSLEINFLNFLSFSESPLYAKQFQVENYIKLLLRPPIPSFI